MSRAVVVGAGIAGLTAARDLVEAGASERVETYGVGAQVRYTHETTFLSRFEDGWFVMAAGCAPAPQDRYDCVVEAG